jgi:NADPH:quinone reductase-like Zn-dependent oxidoreductase
MWRWSRMDYVKALSADQVMDYKKQDFTQNGQTYDVIFDILGMVSFSRAKQSLKPEGILLYASFKGRALWDMLWTWLFSRQKVICAMADEKIESLELVRQLAETGKIKTMLDKRFPLEQAAEAHRYIEAGHRQGNVVISVD